MALLSHITNQIKLKIDYLRLQVRWESNWFEFIHFWGCVSSLKLKCVTGFGDKVSPVSEILKSQGWPVPPRPPHFGRLCFTVKLIFHILFLLHFVIAGGNQSLTCGHPSSATIYFGCRHASAARCQIFCRNEYFNILVLISDHNQFDFTPVPG